jgi:hypothetical protein
MKKNCQRRNQGASSSRPDCKRSKIKIIINARMKKMIECVIEREKKKKKDATKGSKENTENGRREMQWKLGFTLMGSNPSSP